MKKIKKAQTGRVVKTTTVKKEPVNPMKNYAQDFNLLTTKPLKPEPPIGDYKITSGSKGVMSRVRKNGGPVKKGGMAAFEKTAFDKKADRPGGRHGKEGSAKDKRMDKIDAKKMGFIKGKKK